MKTCFLNKLCTFFILFSLFLGSVVFAEPNTKIAIFPFSITASEPNQHFQNKISKMISTMLEQEGVMIVSTEGTPDFDSWDYLQFRKHGIQLGVDYILTGSIFVVGEAVSIDSKLTNVYEKKSSSTFYSDAKNFENVSNATSIMSKEIIGELFQKKIITDLVISGNQRVESDAIYRILDIQTGDIIKEIDITQNIRKIYQMGYFDDVVVSKSSHDKGIKLTFKVDEKPSVRQIKFKKNTIFKDEKLTEVMNLKTGSILNQHNINSDVDRMRLLYTEKNYHNCSIAYEIIPLENSQADVVFTIDEGKKIRVEKITFEGNNNFSDTKIKKKMETSEKGFFHFFTASGDLNETEVQNDIIRIESLYKNNGFINAKVSDPVIDIGKEFISVHFKIEEGGQYKIQKIDLTGDLIIPKEEILKELQIQENKFYNREHIRKDMLYITDLYSNKGFANVYIKPILEPDEKSFLMTVTYLITKGSPVYFRRINVSGNLKTRDKVIRREINVVEGDPYSKDNIQKSFTSLNRLDFFDEIDIKPVKTTNENEMDLNVQVSEKRTGNFSIGGGYSSEDSAFGMISIEEKNLFGRGQAVKLSAKLSGSHALYNLSFFEPYLFDTPISAGATIYKEDKEYEYYDKEALGLTLSLGYRFFDYVRVGTSYNIESFEIQEVDTTNTNMTEGSFLTSSITPYIQYDSRNDLFTPTKGQKHKLSIEYAGKFLGGEIDYTLYKMESGIYFPLFWKFTGLLHGATGFLDDRTDNSIEIDYKRFYLGGMRSIRGFSSEDINAKEIGDTKTIGGNKFVQFNAEITFPLSEKYKLIGVVFYDRGDVYRTSEDIDFSDQFSSFGTGIRWNSPMGPIRVEYGWVIDGKNVKDTGDGQFAFSVGAFF